VQGRCELPKSFLSQYQSCHIHQGVWPSMALDDRRKVVGALIEKITIGDGEIDLTYSCLPTSQELCKSQQRLVLVLGITQRQIRVSRGHIPTNRQPRKSLPTSILTLGDLIQVKRYEKKLTLRQLAPKMGITPV
jgi:hypothetical protein